jgi:hypothetical protein
MGILHMDTHGLSQYLSHLSINKAKIRTGDVYVLLTFELGEVSSIEHPVLDVSPVVRGRA